MAFSRVQGGASATNAVTISAVGSGNAICGLVSWDNSSSITITSVSDDKGNTYNLETQKPDTTNNQACQSFSRTNINNAPVTITVNFSSALAIFIKLLVDEFSGVSTATSDERDGSAHGGQFENSPGTGTDAIDSGSFTTTNNGDLIWGGCIGAATTTLASNGTSFSSGTSDTSIYAAQTEFRTQAIAAAGTTATFTQASNTQRVTFMIALKAPAASATVLGWMSTPDYPAVRRSRRPLDETANPVGIAGGQFLPNFLPQWGEQPIATRRIRNPRPFDQHDIAPASQPVATPVFWYEALDAPIRIKTKGRLDDAPVPSPASGQFLPNFVQALQRSDIVQIKLKPRPLDETTGPVPSSIVQYLVDVRSDWQPIRARLMPLAETSAPIGMAPGQFLPNFFQSIQASDLQPFRKRLTPFNDAVSSISPPAAVIVSQNLIDARSDLLPIRIKIRTLDESSAPVGVATGQFLPNFTQALERSDVVQKRRKPRPLDDTASPGTTGIIQTLVDVRSDLFPVRFRMRSLPETSAPIGIAGGQFLPNFLPQWAEQSSLWRRKLGAPAFATSTSDPIFIPPQVFIGTAQAFEQAALQRPRRIIRQLDETLTPRIGIGQFLPSFVSQWGEPATIWKRALGNPATATATIDPIFLAPVPFVHRLQPSDLLPIRRRIIPLAETSAIPPIADGQFLRNFVSQWYERPIPTRRWRGPRPLDPTDAPVSPAPGQFLPNFVQALQRSDSRPYVHYIRILDETTFVVGGLIIVHNFAVCAHTEVSSYGASTRVSSATSTTQFVSC